MQPIISPAALQPVRTAADYSRELNALDLQQQQMGANALNLRTGQMGLQDRERAVREGETIRNALARLGPNAAPEARISAMEGTNLPAGYAAADTLRKAMLDKRKVEAQAIKDEEDARQTAVKTGRLKLQYGIQSLQAAKAPADAISAIDNGVLQGYWDKAYADQLKSEVPQQEGKEFDAYKLRELTKIVDADKLLETHDKSQQRAQAAQQFGVTSAQAAANAAETARAHRASEGIAAGNLGVSKQRLELEKKAATEGGKPPAGYQWAADGSLQFIKGGPADPTTKQAGPPTEDERRSAGLATRMEQAIKKVQEVTKESPTAAKPEIMAEVARGLPLVGEVTANSLSSEARQRVETAQLDSLDAALTLATGAAYTKEQLKNLAKSYFPQIGDDKKTVADKEARLKGVISAARIRAGRSEGDIDKITKPKNPASVLPAGWAIEKL